jgi:hypothetical protein
VVQKGLIFKICASKRLVKKVLMRLPPIFLRDGISPAELFALAEAELFPLQFTEHP